MLFGWRRSCVSRHHRKHRLTIVFASIFIFVACGRWIHCSRYDLASQCKTNSNTRETARDNSSNVRINRISHNRAECAWETRSRGKLGRKLIEWMWMSLRLDTTHRNINFMTTIKHRKLCTLKSCRSHLSIGYIPRMPKKFARCAVINQAYQKFVCKTCALSTSDEFIRVMYTFACAMSRVRWMS